MDDDLDIAMEKLRQRKNNSSSTSSKGLTQTDSNSYKQMVPDKSTVNSPPSIFMKKPAPPPPVVMADTKAQMRTQNISIAKDVGSGSGRDDDDDDKGISI